MVLVVRVVFLSSNSLESQVPRSIAVKLWFLALGFCACGYAGLCAADKPVEKRAEFFDLFQHYLRIDTSNPPGNELPAAQFFANIFEREGIPYEVVESEPGRANIRAVITGKSKTALILLHHMDVVPARIRQWQHGPFTATVDGGFIHGRGSVDIKSLGIFHLNAFLALHRSGNTPGQDVVFMATADEESGGDKGLGWLLEHKPEWFSDIDAVLNEGATGKPIAGTPTYAIEVTQKIPLWLRLETHGKAGHGAVPHRQSAVGDLLKAGEKLQQLQFSPRVIEPVEAYFSALAPFYDSPWRERFTAIRESVSSPTVMAQLHDYDYRLYALLRSSCTPTRLSGSHKTNVVSGSAFMELDCRLLPDANPVEVTDRIRKLVGPQVSVETLLSFKPGVSSSDHPLFSTIVSVLGDYQAGAMVTSRVSPGFTDSHFFRERGIPAFGFSPIMVGEGASGGAHGVNEKLAVDDFYRGLDIVERVVNTYVDS